MGIPKERRIHIPMSIQRCLPYGKWQYQSVFESGDISSKIDERYPQAIGITQILDRVGVWGNSYWELLYNEFDDCPFFTNDFGSAIEQNDDPRIQNRIIPLTPKFAIRIIPNYEAKKFRADHNFSQLRYRKIRLDRSKIIEMNRLIARCGENLVFFRDKSDAIEKFLNKNKQFWVEPTTSIFPAENGMLHVFGYKVAARGDSI